MYQLVLRIQAARDCAWEKQYHRPHREALNALLGTGVGRRRSYGFGMLQTRDDATREVSA